MKAVLACRSQAQNKRAISIQSMPSFILRIHFKRGPLLLLYSSLLAHSRTRARAGLHVQAQPADQKIDSGHDR